MDCFKAYDIRGRIPDQLNEDIAERIGRAYAEYLRPATVVVGHDMRLSSPGLATAVARGLNRAGVDVLDIGLCGTEEIYFATWHLEAGGGIMVTASHNPADYNGMKLVASGSRPISGDSGLNDIRDLAAGPALPDAATPGARRSADVSEAYIGHLLSYVDTERLKPLKIVSNPGNGGAGLVIDRLAPRLPFEFVRIQHEPDGTFPNGVPNPLLPENRAATADAVRESGADLGLAWDGDFDRCFLFERNRGVSRGLLHRRPAGPLAARATAGCCDHSRPPAHLEYPRNRRGLRRCPGAVEDRARLHQGADAQGRRALWR